MNKKKIEYRLIVGEVGNEMGHVIGTKAQTEHGARVCLGRELAKYHGDGWGGIECRVKGYVYWHWLH